MSHEFVQVDDKTTYCQYIDCGRHYSESVHHQAGFTCPNGIPCTVCSATITATPVRREWTPEERAAVESMTPYLGAWLWSYLFETSEKITGERGDELADEIVRDFLESCDPPVTQP